MKFILLFILSIFAISNVNSGEVPGWMKKDGWVTFHEVCTSSNKANGTKHDCSNPTKVMEKKLLPTWAAETASLYYNVKKKTFVRFKLRITWITDASLYGCGEIIERVPSELKDFTHRSLAMSEC